MATQGFKVCGRVQGVGFRWSTKMVARKYHLNGYCKNLADGSVEICAQGSEEDLAEFKCWLQKGPAPARVISVEEFEPKFTDWSIFDIR